MKEFTSLLKVTPTDGTAAFEFLADHFDFNPTSADEEGGISWSCDKTFVIDIPEKKALQYFAIPRKAIVTLTASDRTTYDIGATEVPARVHIQAHLQKAQLIMDCTMLANPLA